MKTLFAKAKVIPVLVFSDAATAVPTGTALVAGGLPVLEVTLRPTPPGTLFRLWSGLCRTPRSVSEQCWKQTKYSVPPISAPSLPSVPAPIPHSRRRPPKPACSTCRAWRPRRKLWPRVERVFVSEILPAEQAGGVALLKSFASPFGDVAFCPTGGIGPGNLGDYLAQPNVVCVGGSCVANAKDMANQDWKGIEQKAEQACAAIKSS